MKELYRQIIAGLVAVAALASMITRTDFVFWFNLVISGALGLGTYFTIPKKKEAHEIEIVPGLSKAEYNKMISLLDEYSRQFSALAAKSQKREISGVIRDVTDILRKLSYHFHQDPSNINNVPLLEHYLTQSFEVVHQYVRLTTMSLDSEGQDPLGSVESTLYQIRDGFKEIYKQCTQGDLIDLEVKSETLKAIMELNIPTINLTERSKP